MPQTPLELFGTEALIGDEDRAIRDTVRSFADKQIKPHLADWFEAGEVPVRELAPELGKLGVLGMHLEGYGLAPGWTLNFEMYFYLVFALALLLPESRRIPALLVYFGASAALGWVWGPFDTAIGQTYTSPMLLEFVAGVLIAHAWLSGWLNVSTRLSAAAIILGFFALLFVDRGVEGIAASLIVVGALNRAWAGWHHGLLRRLGDASYSIYLTHLFTLAAVRVSLGHIVPPGPSPLVDGLFLCLGLVASAAVGYASYVCMEKPLLSRFRPRSRIEQGSPRPT